MGIRERARLFCLFAAGAVVCAAQQDQRATAMQWADHYAAVYQVPRELVHSIIEIESGWHPRAISNKGARSLIAIELVPLLSRCHLQQLRLQRILRNFLGILVRIVHERREAVP